MVNENRLCMMQMQPWSIINVPALPGFVPLCLGTDTICDPRMLVIPGTGFPQAPEMLENSSVACLWFILVH